MNKSKFDGFINRYNLGGEIESVMVKADGKNLSVRMISDDKTLLGDWMKQFQLKKQLEQLSSLIKELRYNIC